MTRRAEKVYIRGSEVYFQLNDKYYSTSMDNLLRKPKNSPKNIELRVGDRTYVVSRENVQPVVVTERRFGAAMSNNREPRVNTFTGSVRKKKNAREGISKKKSTRE